MFSLRNIGTLAAGSYCAVAAMFVLISGGHSNAHAAEATVTPVVSQSPLSVGGNAPGNLLLTPSVEFPTVDSVANLGAYSTSAAVQTYAGYFDPGKCYRYQYYATETATEKRHFYPSSTTTTRTCAGSDEWSGNFLNWAATQTIDPFRKALTGGLRVVDTTTVTLLEKARSDNQSSSSYFPNRNITSGVSGATAATWSGIYTRVSRLGNRLHFARTNATGSETAGEATVTHYTGAALTDNSDNTIYEVNVRVRVCVPGMLESNCEPYGTNYKPEGLIQKYASRIRYSAWGYLNDPSADRDGGALRARQKFVGPYRLSFNTEQGWVDSANPAREWDPVTGILVQNPDAADATATTTVVSQGSGYSAATMAVTNSGVINYINKFGQMTTQNHKNLDPVSELYYAALRYLKNQGNVARYTNLTGNAQNRYNHADGFPVITNWDDPIQYRCQNNAILGIGDVYTHRDKNLPGNNRMDGEPGTGVPPEVTADNTLDVRTVMQKVWNMEFGSTSYPMPMPQGATENSPYIAALAYHANTSDLRPLLDGRQSASTYWVDVRENQRLEDRNRNQYWLAAKYGGFDMPDDFDPATATALPANSWESDETLSHWTGSANVTRTRPSNFYVASEANQMVASLTRAFANIVADVKGSASSLAANSTRLDTETRTFQAQFNSGVWSGELNAFSVDPESGELSSVPVWRASTNMISGPTAWNTRNIKAANEAGTALVNFTSAAGGLSTAQLARFGSTAARRTAVVDYLRGERRWEETASDGYLRTRDTILGDIVNSTPLFIGAPNASLHAGASYAGASTYAAWATDNSRRNRTPIVYVGANDGMLHAFNASTGAEVFAFVPNTVIENGLVNYSDPLYDHQFFVDGETAAAEIYDTSTSTWRTVLVGSLGRGGPGLFALDVTNPGAPTLMWEKGPAAIAQLGKNIGRPVIAQVASGDWRVLLGNGPDSGDGAYMVSIRLGSSSNGDVNVHAVETSSDNALTSLLVRDTNTDSFADTVYAGDLHGSLWKITGIAGTPSTTRLFQATDPSGVAQPITAAPMVGRDPGTGYLWVFFGTGKYLNEDDLSVKQVQTWYGIIDSGAEVAKNDLVEREILVEATVNGLPARVIEYGAPGEMVGKKGWYINLVSPGADGEKGERMVVQNRFQGEALIGTTRIPEYTDPCEPGGTGFIMAINPFTGGRLVNNFFDMSGDGISNQADMYCDGTTCVPVSGIGFTSSPNNPIFIESVMQVGLDSGVTETIRTFGSSVEASRMSWRELFNN